MSAFDIAQAAGFDVLPEEYRDFDSDHNAEELLDSPTKHKGETFDFRSPGTELPLLVL